MDKYQELRHELEYIRDEIDRLWTGHSDLKEIIYGKHEVFNGILKDIKTLQEKIKEKGE